MSGLATLLAVLETDAAPGEAARAEIRRLRATGVGGIRGTGVAGVACAVAVRVGLRQVRDPGAGVKFRQAVGLTYRLGTGTGIDPDDPFRIPTGDGQNDVEVTSITDVFAGTHAWATIIARYTAQYALDGIARIPDASGSPFVPLTRRRQARTELGNRLEIAVAPRWVLNDYLSFGGRWRWLRHSCPSPIR